MANLITLVRLFLLLPLVASIYQGTPAWQLLNAPLLLVIIALDGLDGYVARRRRESSVFGSIFDIVADRVVEAVLWVVLGELGLVPLWAAIVFIVRGIIVDAIRYAAVAGGATPFGMMQSGWGRRLVAGRFMRGLYGTVKAVTFAWVLAMQPMPELVPGLWPAVAGTVEVITLALVVASVALCLLRGLPVVSEFLAAHKVFAIDDVAKAAR